MIKLPILPTPDRDSPCCTYSDVSQAFMVHNTPGFPECCVVVSAVTGGSFTEYLQEMKDTSGALCVILQPMHHAFSLPCYSGIGEPLPPDALQKTVEESKSCKSSRLMCRYYYDQSSHTVILFDDEDTLCEKAAEAERLGYRYLLGDASLLKKIKTP